MATLDEQQKRWIIRRIARFVSKKQIADDFQVVYGSSLESSQLATFDPECAHGERLGEDLTSYFWDQRKAYLADEETIPIAHRAHRVRLLTALLEHKTVANNPFLIKEILEQAAKEMGGMYQKQKPDGGGDTLRELRTLLGAPLDAGESGPVEAERRDEIRQRQQAEDRDAEARRLQEAAEKESAESQIPDTGGAPVEPSISSDLEPE